MIRKRAYLLLAVLYSAIFYTFGQVKTPGLPRIRTYSPSEYNLHPKNFSITQNDLGMMYFGNAYGILEFDGSSWNVIKLPDGKSALSLSKDKSGGIVVGSVNEAGVLKEDNEGSDQYRSLLNAFSDKDNHFNEVSRTFCVGNQKVFVSMSQISLYNGGRVEVLKPTKTDMVFDFAEELNGNIYVRESGKGLLKLSKNKLERMEGGDRFAYKNINAILQYKDKDLMIISPEGVEIYDGRSFASLSCPLNKFIFDNNITKGIRLKNGNYALGSVNRGIVIFNDSGIPVQFLDKRRGLPSNYVYDLFQDKHDNLWIATDNGISCIQINSAFTYINENFDVEGMGHTAFIHNKSIYLGTSQGLFVKDYTSFTGAAEHSIGFEPINATVGQVWNVDTIGGTLLCGNNNGLFEIIGKTARKISPEDYTGAWTFKPFKDGKLLIVGTYQGLEVYKKSKTGWTFSTRVKGFTESARRMEIGKDNNVWVCHGNNGLYKVKLSEAYDSAIEVKNMSLLNQFNTDYFNDVAIVDEELIFAADDKFWKYNPAVDKLEPHYYLNSLLPGKALISRLVQQENKDVWFVNNDVINILKKQQGGRYNIDTTTFSNIKGQLIGSYEFFRQYDQYNALIGSQNGFLHFNPSIPEGNKEFGVAIRKIEVLNGKSPVLHSAIKSIENRTDGKKHLELPFENNALRISYSAMYYNEGEKTRYQYYLEKVDDDDNKNNKNFLWSMPISASYKEFGGLAEGKYVFHLRARNAFGKLSNVSTYQFSILPPWYRTTTSYFLYALVLVTGIVYGGKLVSLKLEKEKKRVASEKEKEIQLLEKQFAEEKLKAENESILFQKEKLEAEVRFKNDELATLATNLSQKTEFLSKLKNDLVAISKENKKAESQIAITKLIKTIDKGIEFDDGWNHFQANFDTIHHNFLYKLRERFSHLKPLDLLLCAYIRMNKTNKEISSLLSISLSAVEKRRFRLREKLKLDNETSLTDFLLEI